MDKSKEAAYTLREKVFSPLYISIALVLIIIVGNVCRWADDAYGTHLNKINPLLVFLAIFLFAVYIYSIWGQCKKK